jgi:hypothetical protein
MFRPLKGNRQTKRLEHFVLNDISLVELTVYLRNYYMIAQRDV